MMKCPVAKSGHHVHEDCPDEVAKMIEDFIKVFKLGLNEKVTEIWKSIEILKISK